MASFVNRATVTDGNTYQMPQNGYVIIGSVSATVTVLIDLTGSGTYYSSDITIASGNAKTTQLLPSGAVLKFTGGNVNLVAFA